MTQGRIHSLESFGTVDGPGTRYVVFVQGCPMRCMYCHNPDTWAMTGGTMMDPEYIFEQYKHNEAFYKNGGLTVTGGEPLMQVDFLIDLFTVFKKDHVHTCIDSSGIAFDPDNSEWMEKLDRLLELTDLIMLDIKHIDPDKHLKLTGQPNDKILAFARYLDQKKIDVWIRHVVVPGLTDDDEYLYKLGSFIGKLSNVKALDVLPYHTMGTVKYEKLGYKYRLEGTPAMTQSEAIEKKQVILNGIRDERAKNKKE